MPELFPHDQPIRILLFYELENSPSLYTTMTIQLGQHPPNAYSIPFRKAGEDRCRIE
jgi:hypothetical protein